MTPREIAGEIFDAVVYYVASMVAHAARGLADTWYRLLGRS